MGNICIAIICFPVDDVTLSNNLNFLLKLFSYVIKKSGQKFKRSAQKFERSGQKFECLKKKMSISDQF